MNSQQIQAALSYIPAHDRDLWLRMGMAVKSELGEAGFAVWDEWSRGTENYRERDAQSVWRSVKPDGKVTAGTLVHEARKHGFKPTGPYKKPDPVEIERRKREQAERTAKADAEQRQKHETVAAQAQEIWKRCKPVEVHEYATAKGIKPTWARLYQGPLIISRTRCDGALTLPIVNAEDAIRSLQFITPAGEKLFLPNGEVSGNYFSAGDPGRGIIIAEGYATAASIHTVIGRAVIVAFNAGNLWKVAAAIRAKFPQADITIAGDNDQWTNGNPGTTKAREAAQAIGANYAIPKFADLAGKPTDFNDLQQREGLDAVRAQIEGAGPAEQPAVSGSATSQTGDDLAIAELSKLSPIEYERRRETEAEKLRVRVSILDKLVAAGRAESDQSGAGSAMVFKEVEPWSHHVDGAALLSDLRDLVCRYVVLPDHAAEVIALWVLHTYAHDTAQVSPILCFSSPEKRCGKTTALSLLQMLVNRPVSASNITAAALFRATELWRPTLLIDEADTFLRDSDELRGILNSGHNKASAYVIRTVGDEHEPRQFCTWAPKAIALIGRMDPTLIDRSIIIRMRRKFQGDRVERFTVANNGQFGDIVRRCARWAKDRAPSLVRSNPDVPKALNDRAADNWRHLLAIADSVEGQWPEFARKAAVWLGNAAEDEAVRVMLLGDIKALLADPKADRIASADLAEALAKMEERPWPEWHHGKPITPKQIASLLSAFEVKPKLLRIGAGEPVRGYELSMFDDAFARYLPISSVTPLQTNADAGFQGFRSVTPKNLVTDEKASKPAPVLGCNGVTDQKGENWSVRV